MVVYEQRSLKPLQGHAPQKMSGNDQQFEASGIDMDISDKTWVEIRIKNSMVLTRSKIVSSG